MLHSTNPIIKHKTGLLNLAEKLGNVSQACRIMGVSRDTFYRYQEAMNNGGVESYSMPIKESPTLKATENAVVKHATDFPAHGQTRASNELRKIGHCLSQRCA